MLKEILNLNGVTKLNSIGKKEILGGAAAPTAEYTCWNNSNPDPGSSFQSNTDVSNGDIDCVYNSISTIPVVTAKTR